jgi:hypothetical protein
MEVAAPRGLAPGVRPHEARRITSVRFDGKAHTLYVAPTKSGGYCYVWTDLGGGCRARHDRIAKSVYTGGEVGPNGLTVLETSFLQSAGERLVMRFRDGPTADVPFVWVSAPIAAGFFSYDIPAAHWNARHRLVSVTLYAAGGRRLGRQAFPLRRYSVPTRIPPLHGSQPLPRLLPAAPPIAPSRPRPSGAADGFAVVVGHNGAVQFVQTAPTPILAELTRKTVGYGCFRLTTEFGIFTVRELSYSGRLEPRVGLSLGSVGTPFDGCEVEAPIGRTWPDRLHDHAAVEIALTPAGRAYFADRAAARDLALFVHARRVQVLRREPARRAKADLLRFYRSRLAHSPIRVTVVDPATLRFTERSRTGRVFRVTVRRGRIAGENLKPYAFVF